MLICFLEYLLFFKWKLDKLFYLVCVIYDLMFVLGFVILEEDWLGIKIVMIVLLIMEVLFVKGIFLK